MGSQHSDLLSDNIGLTTYRVHDAALGRWWQVDPDAEMYPGLSPYNSMLNNPVLHSDPNGDNPLLIGAAIGLVSNGISNLAQGNNFFQGGFQAAFFGAVGGGISAGIGSAAQGLANAGWSQLGVGAFQAGSHALSGGAMSAAQGGNFWHGAAAGGLSSAVGSGIAAADGGSLAQWIGGGVSGGLGSMIAGGSFVDGAAQGLITGGLNHAADQIQYQLTKARLITAAQKAGLCTTCTHQEIGAIFENIVATHLTKEGFVVTPGVTLQTAFGNTIPDLYIGLQGDKSGRLHLLGGMVEVKAKVAGSRLGLTSQNGQLFKQLYAHAAAWGNGRGTHTLVTTGAVKVSPMVRIFASGLGIRSNHISATYSGSLSISNIGFKPHY